jgi:hypothetical protein
MSTMVDSVLVSAVPIMSTVVDKLYASLFSSITLSTMVDGSTDPIAQSETKPITISATDTPGPDQPRFYRAIVLP